MDNYVYHLDYPFDKIKLISEINSQELTKFSELNPNWLRTSNTGFYGLWLFNHFQQSDIRLPKKNFSSKIEMTYLGTAGFIFSSTSTMSPDWFGS